MTSFRRSIARALARMFSTAQYNPLAYLMRHKLRDAAMRVDSEVLDIGAGLSPYASLFPNARAYVRTNTRSHYGDRVDEELERKTDVWIEDGTRLPFDDGRFGAVCLFQVQCVVSEPDKLFLEIRRVMQPGGVLFLSTNFLYPAWSDHDFMHRSAMGIRHIATANGWEVRRLESFGGFWSMRYMVLQAWLRGFPAKLKLGNGSVLPPLLAAFALPFVLLIAALLSPFGFLASRVERKVTKEFRFNFNTYLEAVKPTGDE